MEKTYTIPIGPVHVGLKEPITAWLSLEGEKIVDATVRPGAIHRGIEFMARERNPIQVIYLSERICGICSFSHVVAFLRAVEDAADYPVTPRGQYIRTLVLELERLHSHILWAGVACYSIGFDSAFHLGMVLREKVMDVLEALSGNRVNYGVATVGGVRWDITPEVSRAVKEMVKYYKAEFGAFYDVVTADPIAKARMRNVGVLTEDEAVRYNAVGPTARASGVRCDIRETSPYEAYADFNVKAIVPQDYYGKAYGDVFDRFLVRVLEVHQSLNIIEHVMEGLPEGEIVHEKNLNKVLAALKKAEGTGWSVIEAPRGDDTHVVHLKAGEENVNWWKVRAPTYANAVSWPLMFRDNELADAPLIINSIDPCISCMERMLVTDSSDGAARVFTRTELVEMSREKTRRLKQGC
ncbi:MAG: nickel-dependent hydrogenase large subunit [Synergistota bacterium]|nr:nickel-dependent hydrogenase large subunit [Synergistota bacterium]OPZ36772.1 MAG: Formate hydrogenlyase subunit 5 precursor [Synergistetes bacterium ADurb.BinA166]